MDALTDQGIKIISQVGFPVFVAAYLLIRTDKLLRELTTAVKELTQAVARLAGPAMP